MGGVINVRDQEQGIQHIADLEGSIDGAVTHLIPSRPFRLAGMLSQPHGARKGPPKGKVRRAQTPSGAASPRRRPIAPKAHRPAAGDTRQEAEAKLNKKGRLLPGRPYCFEDHEYQRAGRCGYPNH